jgi:hypothetical protein
MVKVTALLLAAVMILPSCSSTTLIQSNPAGAKLYLNGEPMGTTPYSYSDTKIFGSTNVVKLEKEGYEALNTTFSRDEEVDAGAIIGGFFFLVPFLWAMKYKPVRTYELAPYAPERASGIVPVKESQFSSVKAQKLRELKQLLDDKFLFSGWDTHFRKSHL